MKQLLLIAGIATSVLLTGNVQAQSTGEFAKFAEASDTLRMRMNYDIWTDVLDSIVLHTGTSNRFFYRPRLQRTGTRLSRTQVSPSWMEGNRVFYHDMGQPMAQHISNMRAGFEAIFDEREFSRLTKDQQLSYWLNLYNMAVVEIIAGQYPVQDVERIRNFWDMKVIMVAGVEMSLNDIHHEIILKNWDNPLVIYGLHQGAIGGPNILRTAYSADNVWLFLRINAREFVNSIRGIRTSTSGDLMISEYYDWNRAMFPDFENDVRRHMADFADEKTGELLALDDEAEPKYFDWIIADILQGTPNDGNMYASILGTDFMRQGNAQANGVGAPTIVQDWGNGLREMGSMDFDGPPIMKAFFSGLDMKFKQFGYPDGEVIIENVDQGTEVDVEAESE